MATEKATAEASAPAGTPAPVESFDLPLAEFCLRLSADKVSPEMIGGFHHSQVAAGNTKASSAAFAAAFEAFKKQPA